MSLATTLNKVQQFWDLANRRQWPEFAELLHPELVYLVPQTRERVEGREGFVNFFSTWPGDWNAKVDIQIADAARAVTTIDFVDETGTVTGISFFEFNDGLISKIVDYWPDSYEPPARVSPFVQRY
ncbi:MAG: nuclear transport factor 2 family protein [Pseudomonadota bacterium]